MLFEIYFSMSASELIFHLVQKSLNLKQGANSITFSLSASGVVAATARIFVWEYSDLVVVSDIDGTITK